MADNLELTTRQKEVLDFYVAYIQKHSHSPMLREAGDSIGIHTVHVCQILEKLEGLGYIKRRNGQRNVILTDKALQ